jgi:sortase A
LRTSNWLRYSHVEMPSGSLRRIQRLLGIVGICLLAAYVVAQAYAISSSRLAVWAFQASQRFHSENVDLSRLDSRADFTLWSPQRVRAYEQSLALKLDHPTGVMKIPKINLTAPIFDGTDGLTLDRGLGRIIGTAQLGTEGNIGIAGHRDGFFRGLKDISTGDAIEISITSGEYEYIVDHIEIVDPDNVAVLKPRPTPGITLVTCYPFYFVGDAPKRYIVEASLAERNAGIARPFAELEAERTQGE